MQDNGGCSDICIPIDDDVGKCSCLPGRVLGSDGKKCYGKSN